MYATNWFVLGSTYIQIHTSNIHTPYVCRVRLHTPNKIGLDLTGNILGICAKEARTLLLPSSS